jgi:hypothetical protein
LKTLAPEKVVELSRLPAEKLEFVRIIAAVNPAMKCEATACYAAEIARRYGASLYIVHVFWPSMRIRSGSCHLIDQEQRESWKMLQELAAEVRNIAPQCRSALLAGEPAERIFSLARDIRADLSVASGYYPLLLSSSICRAPCSILVYHEGNLAVA